MLGGLFSKALGGSGSSSGSKGPKTKRDPSRREDYLELSDSVLETELGVRGKWTDDGLLISTRIEETPDKGTFQSVFLEDCSGRRLAPVKLELYKIWPKATLTVSWTKTTYLNGSVIVRQSGGWSQSWNHTFSRYGRGSGDESGGPRLSGNRRAMIAPMPGSGRSEPTSRSAPKNWNNWANWLSSPT